ncbi:MAG: hypothetical protein WC666_04790 [Candidatus Paceibacterota bacterium]|jgi:hypothetical protein
MTYYSSQKGYTLIFAVIVSSVVLSIGAFILSISRKQFILSSAARDSTKAIYAADSGIQCAVEAYFGFFTDEATTTDLELACNGSKPTGSWGQASSVDPLMKFETGGSGVFVTQPMNIYLSGNKTCAKVIFYSGVSSVTKLMKTYIESRGYSMSDGSSCPISNPRTVERAIYLVYE